MELPECPVCLQVYDGGDTIPRVLACGHSACQACLVELPQRYPDTIRCPACTQLVRYPSQQGPSALPKNIDLLRICIEQSPSQNPNKPIKIGGNYDVGCSQFCPRFWSDEFYGTWKDWVLPYDVVSVDSESDGEGRNEFWSGRFGGSASGSKGRVWYKKNQSLSLVPIAPIPPESDSKFKFSHVARIMKCLYGMEEVEREELSLILSVPAMQSRIIKAYGLWSDVGDGYMYLVSEGCDQSFSKKICEWINEFNCVGENGLSRDEVCAIAMIGMNLCEALISMFSERLVAGCFGPSCFCFDEFGGICMDLTATLVMDRKVHKKIANASSGSKKIDDVKLRVIHNELLEDDCYLSPEVLVELLKGESAVWNSGCSRYPIGPASDVWSVACMLTGLVIGNAHYGIASETSKESYDFATEYARWLGKVNSFMEQKLDLEYMNLRQTLCKCLSIDPGSRPDVHEVWKCLRELLIKPKFDFVISLDDAADRDNIKSCLILGKLCQMPMEKSNAEISNGLGEEKDCCQANFDQDDIKGDTDFALGLSKGTYASKDLLGHLDCITGLVVGGSYLFSSSFDKTVKVWSLQDFSHVHTFRGHEQKVMALVYVDGEEPLCISGDSGGDLFVWGIITPLGTDPVRKWNEQKDWRFSGIHALATSGRTYLYSGSGDRTIKAWSLLDGTLSYTMNGHRSVVSTLVVCDDVLYSGSWDGTIRLWSLNDHSPLTVLGEGAPNDMRSVTSIAVDKHMLVAAHENGCVKFWRNDVYMESKQLHNGSIFAISMHGRWLYSGGWDKMIHLQEFKGDELQIDVKSFGSISCGSVVTALLCWQGKLFVGFADKSIKVYYHGK